MSHVNDLLMDILTHYRVLIKARKNNTQNKKANRNAKHKNTSIKQY